MKSIAMLVALTVCSLLQSQVKTEKVNYKGWPNSYRVSNGQVELIVTGDVGPRIIRYGFIGGQNLLKEFDAQLGKSGEKDFQLRGGDRARFFWMPRIGVSSTMVRRRVRESLPVRYLIPDPVVDYIQSNGLYGGATTT